MNRPRHPVGAHPVHQHLWGTVPYRQNDRPVGAAVPEGMEGTMSSPVSLFKTAALVVDLRKRQRPPGTRGQVPEVHPPSGRGDRLQL